MLIVNRIGEDAGRYYFDGPAGRWCGAGRRDLDLDGIVTRKALETVLSGRNPVDGAPLSDRRTPHRQAGWDLIFTAPKSVSLLAALCSGDTADAMAGAHRRACADAFIWLEGQGCWARRQGGRVATAGFVAARFTHRVNASGEPHLHTHVLIANVVRSGDGRWSAIDGSGLWLNRRAVAAAYHLALRQQVLAAGIRPEWALRPDGAADIADVPRRAVEATSTRRHQIQRRLRGHDDPAPLTRTSAQRVTRREPIIVASWRERSLAAGFGTDEARRIIDHSRWRASLTEPVGRPDPAGERLAGERLARDVTTWLAQRRSSFSVVDVMQALSATHPEGTTAAEAHRWAREYYDASPLAADGRRTSALARAADEALVRAGRARTPGTWPLGSDARHLHDTPPRSTHGQGRGHGLDILAPPDAGPGLDGWRVVEDKGGFVAQAAALDEARRLWQRSGRTVAVDTPSEGAARRWRALSGLDRHRPGAAPPDVLVVDRADRRPTAELTVILEQADRSGTHVVLVQGGTRPARRSPVSQGLQWLGEQQGRVVPATPLIAAAGDSGEGSQRLGRHHATFGAGPPDSVRSGRLVVCPSGRQALEQVVTAWSGLRSEGVTPRMVAWGPAECDSLNRRARTVLRAAGALTGEEVVIAGRPFAVGDTVTATRRGVLPAGAVGHVSEIDTRGSMVVQWSGPPAAVDAWNGRHLRHAYATTVGMLHFEDSPLITLGDPDDLGRYRERAVAGVLVAATGPRLEAFARGDLQPRSAVAESIEWHVDALTRIAETEPGAFGPLPADATLRQEWRTATRGAILQDHLRVSAGTTGREPVPTHPAVGGLRVSPPAQRRDGPELGL